MAKKVYAVFTTTGKYEDTRITLIRVFVRKATANRFAEKKNEELKNYGAHATQCRANRDVLDMPRFRWVDSMTGGEYFVSPDSFSLDED